MSVKDDVIVKQCAGGCGDLVRPRGTSLEDFPDTIGVAHEGWCRKKGCMESRIMGWGSGPTVEEKRLMDPHSRAVDEGWPLSALAGFSGPNTAGRFTYWCKFCDFDGPARSEREARQYVYGHFFKYLPEREKQ